MLGIPVQKCHLRGILTDPRTMKNNYLAFVGVLVAASMTTLATGQAGMTPDLLQKTKSRVAVKGEVSRTPLSSAALSRTMLALMHKYWR